MNQRRPERPRSERPAASRDVVRPLSSTVLLSKVLDDLIPIPGTKQTIGADAILAFVPGIGDAAGTAMGGLILVDAVRCRVPLPVLVRMIVNVAADFALGAVPVLGGVFDMLFRSNRMNMRLLERAIDDGETARRRSIAYFVTAAVMIVSTLLILVGGAILTLVLFFRWLNGA